MRNRRGGRVMSKNGMMVLCGVLALVLIVLIVVAVKMGTEQTPDTPDVPQTSQSVGETQIPLVAGPMDEMMIDAVEEGEDAMYVTTSYINFTYPYAFSDLLVIEEVNEESCVGLTVSVFLQGRNEKTYTIWINSDRGMPVGALHRGEKTYRVSMEMYDPRENMSEVYLSTFYAVQETLNDVLQSMAADGDFVYSVGGEA